MQLEKQEMLIYSLLSCGISISFRQIHTDMRLCSMYPLVGCANQSALFWDGVMIIQ